MAKYNEINVLQSVEKRRRYIELPDLIDRKTGQAVVISTTCDWSEQELADVLELFFSRASASDDRYIVKEKSNDNNI